MSKHSAGIITRFIRARRRKFVLVVLWMLNQIFQKIPLRVSYLIVLATHAAMLPGHRGFAQALKPVVIAALLRQPHFRFINRFGNIFPFLQVLIAYRIGAYQEVRERVTSRMMSLGRTDMALVLGRSCFELGDFATARRAFEAMSPSALLACDPDLAEFKAQLDLIAGDEQQALAALEIAVRKPRNLCPHQNMAARYPHDYEPTALDLTAGPDGRLFDACNLTGQRVTHVGEGQLGCGLFGRAFQAQETLRVEFPKLSPELKELLSGAGIPLDDLRVIPAEWFTQIGHLGMMDMLFRMRALGWWKGTPVFLPTPSTIANQAFLRLFEQYGPVLTEGENVSVNVASELFSLQRWCGLGFNAFKLPDGRVVPWQDAGAIMLRQWEHEQRRDPLRDEYDRLMDCSPTPHPVKQLRAEWGLKPDDWYICLHLRDATHYGELSGTGQTHRNANVESYLDMVRYITQKGGWVIKLGGPKSPKLPGLPRVIDYARGPFRSEIADLDLIRHARLFVGTTSGLTNVAISFGIPCALVNCITVDAQLWNNRVRFAPKAVELRDGSRLSQRELTTEPWRWRVFDAEVLGRFGAVPIDNSSDEILETVKEVEAMERGASEAYLQGVPHAGELLETWQNRLGQPYFYGGGLPSRYYLHKHRSDFLSGDAALLRETSRAPVNSTAA